MSKVWFITRAGRGVHPTPATRQRTRVTALAAEAVLAAIIIAWLRRSPAADPVA